MSMSVYNLLGLRFHGRFLHWCHYSLPPIVSVQVIFKSNHSNYSKGYHYMGKLFFKLVASFYGLVSRKMVLLGSINHITKNLDVFVEFLEFHSSVAFELCLDEDFM